MRHGVRLGVVIIVGEDRKTSRCNTVGGTVVCRVGDVGESIAESCLDEGVVTDLGPTGGTRLYKQAWLAEGWLGQNRKESKARGKGAQSVSSRYPRTAGMS